MTPFDARRLTSLNEEYRHMLEYMLENLRLLSACAGTMPRAWQDYAITQTRARSCSASLDSPVPDSGGSCLRDTALPIGFSVPGNGAAEAMVRRRRRPAAPGQHSQVTCSAILGLVWRRAWMCAPCEAKRRMQCIKMRIVWCIIMLVPHGCRLPHTTTLHRHYSTRPRPRSWARRGTTQAA